ncbi:MAG: enoyl-CoA hydratase/isomerase family protein [Pseudomonadota bacterium]
MASLVKRTEGNVLVVELNRADKGNALNRALQQELAQTWQEFEDTDNQLVAVLQGAGKVFSIGHDVRELASDESMSPVPDNELFPLQISKPVIAAIEGPCYGLGFELALGCDLRIAGEEAMFGLADPNLFVPYRLATVLLPRMTFLGKSLELIFAGRILDAEQMSEARLVSQVTAKGEAAAIALEAARDMAQRFPSARAFRKRNIWNLSGMSLPAAMSLARKPQI